MMSADRDDELRLAPGNYILDSTKRERLGSKLSSIRNVFFYAKDCSESCSSRIHVYAPGINIGLRLL